MARAAAVEVGGEDVGEHLGVSTEDAHAVTHAFVATLAGYRGWHWAVTVARSPQSSVVTVDEVVLLPGDDALRAPEWVPWSQRVRAGDLGAGDLLPADPDDARLVPSYFSDGDPALADADDADRAQMRAVADELGLGRVRVLSRDGRLDAAERWFETDFGPDAPMAKQAPAHCGTCGFLVAVRGSLGAAFGICANELSAADAHVVSVEFGCGAHSEAGVDLSNRVEPAGSVYDSGELVMESTDIDARPRRGQRCRPGRRRLRPSALFLKAAFAAVPTGGLRRCPYRRPSPRCLPMRARPSAPSTAPQTQVHNQIR